MALQEFELSFQTALTALEEQAHGCTATLNSIGDAAPGDAVRPLLAHAGRIAPGIHFANVRREGAAPSWRIGTGTRGATSVHEVIRQLRHGYLGLNHGSAIAETAHDEGAREARILAGSQPFLEIALAALESQHVLLELAEDVVRSAIVVRPAKGVFHEDETRPGAGIPLRNSGLCRDFVDVGLKEQRLADAVDEAELLHWLG